MSDLESPGSSKWPIDFVSEFLDGLELSFLLSFVWFSLVVRHSRKFESAV